jgi:hypothetical protein
LIAGYGYRFKIELAFRQAIYTLGISAYCAGRLKTRCGFGGRVAHGVLRGAFAYAVYGLPGSVGDSLCSWQISPSG